MFIHLVAWCLILLSLIVAVELCRWLFIWPPDDEPDDDECEGMKEACRYDFRKFCEYYLPETFYNEFTPRQARTIAGLQSVILFGHHGEAEMHHGEGTTSMIKAAAIWAAAYRHRDFIVVFTGQASAAEMMRRQVEAELWHNERLWEDFPQIDPWPPIAFLSITESLKGIIETTADGKRIRPDCVLADSIGGWARSLSDLENRRRTFQRFVGALHFCQPGSKKLAVAELVGVEPPRPSTIASMKASEIRGLFGQPGRRVKAGEAVVYVDDQEGDPPAAPQDPHVATTLRNLKKAREAVDRMRSQNKSE